MKESKDNTLEHYAPNYLALFGLFFLGQTFSGVKNSTVGFVQLPH
jgi:hypothetical protein